MKEKHIGIIIQNQDDKILLYDDTFYIKVEIHENDNINNVIASKVKETVDMNIFKIIETYVYTPDSKLVDLNILSDEEFIMYLVEVCIYHNEFNFVKKEDLLDIIPNHSEREFFKENFVDHILYEKSSRSYFRRLYRDAFRRSQCAVPYERIMVLHDRMVCHRRQGKICKTN